MAQAILNRVLEAIKTLEPEELRLVKLAVQSQLVQPGNEKPPAASVGENAWDVLDSCPA